jgi:hypothetical protein
MTNPVAMQKIQELLHGKHMPQTQRMRLLFDTLRSVLLLGPTASNNLQALCTNEFIPFLVDNAKYYRDFVPALRMALGNVKRPTYFQDDLEKFMYVLRGANRPAARAFLTSLNHEATESDICAALRRDSGIVPVDHEQDPNAIRMDSAGRRQVIVQLIMFRRDILPTDMFDLLFKLNMSIEALSDQLTLVCRDKLNPCIIKHLSVLPSAVRVLAQNLYHSTRNETFAQPAVVVADASLRDLLLKIEGVIDI